MSLLRKRKRQHPLTTKGIDFTKHLFSDELVLGTFAYLAAHDLIECGKVSRAWSRLAGDAGLWRPLFEERFNRPLSTFKARWNPIVEYQLPYANWKDQYRIHQNWLTGHCTSHRLDHVAAISDQSNTRDGHKLQGLIQYTNDILCICCQSLNQVDIWHIGKTTTHYIGNIKDDTLDDRRTITFMKLKAAGNLDDDASHGDKRNYTLVIGNSYGGFSVWKFTTTTASVNGAKLADIKRTCHYITHHKDPVVAIDTLHPMLVTCTSNMILRAFDVDQPSPRQIFKLESPVRWSPVVVHLSQHHQASRWKALLCFGVNFGSQSSLGAQEMIFSSSSLSTSSSSPSPSWPSPPSPNTTSFDNMFSDVMNDPTMTSMIYSDPFIMTAYSSNTIKQFRVVSTDDDFRVDFVKTLFGHTCQVSSLALDVDEGRLISGSRAGLKLWDLLSLDQYKKRANDYVVTLQPGTSGAMDIPMDDIIWMQMDKAKIVALLRNGVNNKTWFKIWSFDT